LKGIYENTDYFQFFEIFESCPPLRELQSSVGYVKMHWLMT